MKRRTGMVALCCVGVLALCATSALAATLWYTGKGRAAKQIAAGAPTAVQASGKLAIMWPEAPAAAFAVYCDATLTGTVENPAGGGNGIDTVKLVFANCKPSRGLCAKGEGAEVKETGNGESTLEAGPKDKFENMALEVKCVTKGEVDTWKGNFSADVTTDNLEFAKGTGGSTLKGKKTATTAFLDGKLKKLETAVTPPAKPDEVTAK